MSSWNQKRIVDDNNTALHWLLKRNKNIQFYNTLSFKVSIIWNYKLVRYTVKPKINQTPDIILIFFTSGCRTL